jgi:hypothetical protein
MNLTLDIDAVEILEHHARSRRAYGHYLSEMLREKVREPQVQALQARVQRLEDILAAK